jgi:Cellulase (glycosyl hydrolase family 5)/Concanavalin A-like lectin/glucanases superfamily
MSVKDNIAKPNILDTFSKKRSINNMSPAGLNGNIGLLSDFEMGFFADILVENGCTWTAIAIEAFNPAQIPYSVRFIKAFKSRGLKVHLRTGFSTRDRMKKADGTFEVYSSGTISSKTEVANTAVAGFRNNSTGTITDTTKNWVVDEWKGFQVYCFSTKGKKMVLYITSNTSNKLILSAPYEVGKRDFRTSEINGSTIGGETEIYTELGVVGDLIDTTKPYEISYQACNDNSFTDPVRGLYKHIADNARAGLAAGADSFGCSNEMLGNVQNGIPGTLFENGQSYVQAQKNLVAYIKATVPGYLGGYTVSELFWLSGEWVVSGGMGPLDFFAYTCYEEESIAMRRMKECCDFFGADKVQFDEFALADSYTGCIEKKVAKDVQDYSRLINNRVKWAKHLGIRNIFRWELLDYSGLVNENLGFGYMYCKNQKPLTAQPAPWFTDSFARNINPYIANWSLNFRPYGRGIEVPNSPSLNLTNIFTIQCKVNTSNWDYQRIIEKLNSFGLYLEDDKKITFRVKIAGAEKVIKDSSSFVDTYNVVRINPNNLVFDTNDLNRTFYGKDRWLTILVSYDNQNLRLFINGELKSTLPATGNVDSSTNVLSIGSQAGNNDKAFQGRIQDVEIAKECLYTASYENSDKAPNSKKAVLRVLTEQSSGTTIFDTSGNGNNAIMVGNNNDFPQWGMGIRDKIEDEEKASLFWINNRWTGYNVTGLESTTISPTEIPRGYAKWMYENGINSVRIPILLEKLIPTAYGDVDKTYSLLVKKSLANFQDYGIKVFLDVHNSGFYNFGADGLVAMGKSKNSSIYDTKLHEYFYQKLFDEFDEIGCIEGYMYNAPHDLAVETTPSNYKTLSTATIFQQTALTKLRKIGSTKWFGWTSDNFAKIESIIDRWGTGFDFPWTDPAEKTFLDLHYYHDFYPNLPNSTYVGSGTWGTSPGSGTNRPRTRPEVIDGITKVIARVVDLNNTRVSNGKAPVPLCLSEVGSPSSTDYMKTFDEILSILEANNVGFFYNAIGATATNNPATAMADIKDTNAGLTVYDIRHETVDKYLNKLKTKQKL